MAGKTAVAAGLVAAPVAGAVAAGRAIANYELPAERIERKGERAQAKEQDVASEDERWSALIGSDDPADVEAAIRSNGETQSLSPAAIEAQIQAYRKRHGG